MLPEHWKNVANMQRRRERKEALITSPWALPIAIAIIGLRPLKFIRICGIRNDRIGHFLSDGAEQVVRFKRRGPKETRIYYFECPVSCNQQWETMLRRTLPVKSRSLRHVVRWLRRLPRGSDHFIPSTYTQSRDTEGLFKNGDAALPFTPDEEATALKWLESKGWTKGEPFICLLVRDSAFTVSDPVANHGIEPDPDAWDYHSYRNSDIETYIPAIEWLNAQGVWVFRMGRTMESRVPYANRRFVDYAFTPDKSDLMDILLFARADATISTGTGPDQIPAIYRRPMLIVNFLPVADFYSWCQVVTCPKTLRYSVTHDSLSLFEHLESCYFDSGSFRVQGIDWIDLTSDDIRKCTIRFWKYLQGDFHYPAESQVELWDLIARAVGTSGHGYRHPEARIEPDWLLALDSKST